MSANDLPDRITQSRDKRAWGAYREDNQQLCLSTYIDSRIGLRYTLKIYRALAERMKYSRGDGVLLSWDRDGLGGYILSSDIKKKSHRFCYHGGQLELRFSPRKFPSLVFKGVTNLCWKDNQKRLDFWIPRVQDYSNDYEPSPLPRIHRFYILLYREMDRITRVAKECNDNQELVDLNRRMERVIGLYVRCF